MRISGGIYRGRTLFMPPGYTRPPKGVMREAFFSILGGVEGIRFLDLFSGSGLMGVEAASRGCAFVQFVEMERKKLPTLKRNTAFIECGVSIAVQPTERFLQRCKNAFDVVYADPPFAHKRKAALIGMIVRSQATAPESEIAIHHPHGEPLPERGDGYVLSQQRRYGRSALSFFRACP